MQTTEMWILGGINLANLICCAHSFDWPTSLGKSPTSAQQPKLKKPKSQSFENLFFVDLMAHNQLPFFISIGTPTPTTKTQICEAINLKNQGCMGSSGHKFEKLGAHPLPKLNSNNHCAQNPHLPNVLFIHQTNKKPCMPAASALMALCGLQKHTNHNQGGSKKWMRQQEV